MSLSLQRQKLSNSTKPNKTANHNLNNQHQITPTLNNQTIQKLIKSGIIQPKLKISHPDDPYEKEADRVADQIMRMSISHRNSNTSNKSPNKIHRKCPSCQMKDNKKDELKISRKSVYSNSNLEASDKISNQISNISGGQPLNSSTKSFMEPRFQYDFSDVRIHDDSSSRQLSRAVNASAFTVGNNIFLGNNESTSNKPLMAHELTHVVQQQRDPTDHSILYRKQKTGVQLIQEIRETIAKKQEGWEDTLENLVNSADQNGTKYLYKRLHLDRTKKGKPATMVIFFNNNLEPSYATKLLDIMRNKIGIQQTTKSKKTSKNTKDSSKKQQNQTRSDVNPDISDLSFNKYVDQFKKFHYDLDYKASGGNTSTILQLHYDDGTIIDLDYFLIEDIQVDQLTALKMMKNGYVGDGGRIFPSSLNSQTTPQLYKAKKKAHDIIMDNFWDILLLSTEAVVYIISLTPVGAITSKVSRISVPKSQRTPKSSSQQTKPRKTPTKKPSSSSKSQDKPGTVIVKKIRPVNGTVNVGGGLEKGSKNATNLNPIKPGSGGPSRGISNHIKGYFKDIAKYFDKGSVTRLISSRLRYVDVNWTQATKGAAEVMSPGGKVALNVWTSSTKEIQTIVSAFINAGFKSVKSSGSGPGTMIFAIR